MRDIALFLGGIAVLLPALTRPFICLMLWIWTSLLTPNGMLWGFMAPVPFNKIVVGTTLISLFAGDRKKDIHINGSSIMMMMMLTVGIISMSSTIASSTDVVYPMFDRFWKINVLCVLVPIFITTRTRVHSFAAAVTLGLGYLGVVEGLKFVATAGTYHITNTSNFGDNNHFALACLMIVPIGLYLYVYSEHQLTRLGFLAVSLLSLTSVIATFSRGGFIGLLAMGMCFVLRTRRKVLSLSLIVLAGLPLIFLAPKAYVERINTIESADQDNSFTGRVIAWKISTLIALDRPLLGAGFHGIQDQAVWSRYRADAPYLDFIIPTPEPDIYPHAAHSIYFEILGDLGFTGLTLFLLLLARAAVNTIVIRRYTKGKNEWTWCYDLAGAMQFSLIAFVVSGAALSMGYFELMYVIVALLERLRRTVEAERRVAHSLVMVPARAI